MAENIKLRKRNFTVDEGYFFTIEEDRDNLLSKTDDGNTAFSYPLDTLITQTPLSLEFDGVYFWALMDTGADMRVQRWKIDNYVAKLQQTIDFVSDGSHTYASEAFSVAHYHDTLASGVAATETLISLDEYGNDADIMDFTTSSGDPLTIHLGPNTNGEEEDVQVSSRAGGGNITTVSGLTYTYAHDDPVNFYTNIWLFNNSNGVDTTNGALYKFDAYTGDYIKKYPGGAYRDVDAATFYNVDSFTEYGDVDTLAYIKSTNTLFVNVVQEHEGKLVYYGSMVMDNIQSDESSVLTVYDLAMDDQNVYRLQKGPDGGTGETWSVYSYELSSLDGFVTSISLAAYPAIIAANGISTTDIIAIVKDQFLQPVVARLVYFSENGDGSIVGPGTPVNTNAQGLAQTVYKSGTTAQEVKITAVVEQT